MEQVRGTKRFFKVMMPGFHQTLNLPQAFSKKLKLDKSKQAVIKSGAGTWKIEICSDQESGLICFKDGWPNFVHGHGLSIGDFVVFEQTGNFHFNAVVFEANACEKDYFVAKEPKDAPKKRKADKGFDRISYQSKNPHFILAMKPYHASKKAYVCIPAKFWRSNGIWDETKSVVLRHPSGRKWVVKLYFEKSVGQNTCRLRMGWYDFYEANELKLGDVCAFELVRRNPTNLEVDVQIFPASC